MSIQAMVWAMDQELVENPTARHVLLVLANYADVNGKAAFPSADTLVRQTGLSERAVRNKLVEMEDMGVIVRGNQAIVQAYIDRGDRRPICYDLAMQLEEKRGAAGAPREDTGCTSFQNGVHVVQERGAPRAPNPSFNPSSKPSCAIDEKFDEAWALYPKREGGSSKKAARKAWNARIREGVNPEMLVHAVKAYAAEMLKAQNIGTRFVKQAATFFGPDLHYEQYSAKVDAQQGLFAAGETSAVWWRRAGFRNEWDAMNAGCTERNCTLWRDGRPTRRLAGANVEPWPEVSL